MRQYPAIHRCAQRPESSQTRIDINKGDDVNPVYRSRLVGKEFNNEQMGGLFAGTPPLEALRFLIHEAATVRSGEPKGSKVRMINHISRVFFEAPATRHMRGYPQRRFDGGGPTA